MFTTIATGPNIIVQPYSTQLNPEFIRSCHNQLLVILVSCLVDYLYSVDCSFFYIIHNNFITPTSIMWCHLSIEESSLFKTFQAFDDDDPDCFLLNIPVERIFSLLLSSLPRKLTHASTYLILSLTLVEFHLLSSSNISRWLLQYWNINACLLL